MTYEDVRPCDDCGRRSYTVKHEREMQIAGFVLSQIDYWEKKLRECDPEGRVPRPGSHHAFVLDNLTSAQTAWLALGALLHSDD